MAAPTSPSLASISAEAIQKAGYIATLSSQYTAILARAQNQWAEEVKNDIWQKCKKLKSLQTVGIVMMVKGQANYNLPTDFSSFIGETIQLLQGDTTGTAQDGAVGSITLASTASATNNAYQGKEIVLTGGTGANQVSQCYSYAGSTKVASVAPAYATAPVGASTTYMLVDNYYNMDQNAVWEYNKAHSIDVLERPLRYYPVGDADDGQIYVYPTPDKVYAMRIRYYADLMELDLTSTLLATLYKNWRNVFVQGIYARCLQGKDDDRYQKEMAVYGNLLNNLTAREEYGMDLSNLQMRVVD